MDSEKALTKRLSAKQTAFLAAYGKCANLTVAAQASATARKSHYVWMKLPNYVEAFEAAKEEACEQLEREALRRAVSGVEEPVYHNGKVVGNIRKYSDVLLIFLMKGAMPGRYRDNATVEHTGRGGQPLAVEVKFVRPLLSVMPGRSDTAEEVA